MQNLDFNNLRRFASVKRIGGLAGRCDRPAMLKNVILWIHVVCGAVWVVFSLCFVLAASATAESERASFAGRVGRVFNRLNLAAVVI